MSKLLFMVLIILLSACSNFTKLHDDLAEIKLSVEPITINVISKVDQKSPVIVISFEDLAGNKVISSKVLPKPESNQYNIILKNQYIFAFQDVNRDFSFQSSEPYGWFANGELIEIEKEGLQNLEVSLAFANNNSIKPPENFTHLRDLTQLNASGLKIHSGTVTSLTDPLLSTEHALKGLWQPLDFIRDGGAGIHFLSEYDANKTPVLFVHGINGAPDNFKSLIDKLDKNKYQAWVYSYPSGLSLTMISNGLYNLLATVNHKVDFKQLHIVAHSMGGLVSKGYINLCSKNNSCDYLRSFTSISTPWGGHDAAALGVKYAPEIVPVWHDMSPNSDYLNKLFLPQFSHKVDHTLFFSFKRTSMLTSENTDDVVSVASQLRYEAQSQSSDIYGYNEGHMSILANDALSEKLALVLLKHSH